MIKEEYNTYPHKHLLGIEGLHPTSINYLLKLSEKFFSYLNSSDKKLDTLKNKTFINLFFENSTRTRTSFELAGKKLGADLINISVNSSSIKKGETLIDTAMTLNAMQPNLIVVRHNDAGAVKLLSEKVNCGVINAGDGPHEHPTQALLDAMTILGRKKKISGLRIAICGDIMHSRVARSNIHLLNSLGAEVRVIAPATLIPKEIQSMGVKVFFDMKDGLQEVDIIIMLRLQLERMTGSFVPSVREYFRFYGLDREKLSYANKDAFVLHPGPMNRGVEIDSELADDLDRTAIFEQVRMGVAVRMACLTTLIKNEQE